MPSLRHQLLATVIPKVRRSRELESEPVERARVEAWHRTLEPGLWVLYGTRDLIHVYGILPFAPEARRAFRQVVAFVDGRSLR